MGYIDSSASTLQSLTDLGEEARRARHGVQEEARGVQEEEAHGVPPHEEAHGVQEEEARGDVPLEEAHGGPQASSRPLPPCGGKGPQASPRLMHPCTPSLQCPLSRVV